MKTLLYLATIAACLGGQVDPIYGPPTDPLGLSKVSVHILLVEIKSVERKPPSKTDGGLEMSELIIRAKVIEVVRGDKEKEIEYSDYDVKVVDSKEFERSKYAKTGMFRGPPASEETGSGKCKVGERYVMVYALAKAYFVHVSKGDESWRGKIKKIADEK
jgi:hypothetical protein